MKRIFKNIVKCENCGCGFTYDEEDIELSKQPKNRILFCLFPIHFSSHICEIVKCPECGHDIVLGMK